MIQNRNIATNLILTIVTCGLYGLYWMITITDDIARVNKEQTTSGGIALILSIITCGIYGIYWNYKMGQLLYQTEVKKDMIASDNSIVCLILSLFKFDIISYCILQSELNKISLEDGKNENKNI